MGWGPERNDNNMVAVLLADGFETAEGLVPVDILRRAGVKVVLAGLGSLEVASSHGVIVKAETTVDKLRVEDLDMIVLPGGLCGVENLRSNETVRHLIVEMAKLDKLIGAICAAPVLLAELGILNDKRAVCYPDSTEQIAMRGAKPQTDELVTNDRNIITSKAAGTSFDFGLKLVAMLLGWQASEKVRKSIYYRDLSVSLT